MFENKFTSSSRRMVSEIDIDVIYLGVSRGFNSKLDWQTNSVSHKFTVGESDIQIIATYMYFIIYNVKHTVFYLVMSQYLLCIFG